jgi:hypothetical protein
LITYCLYAIAGFVMVALTVFAGLTGGSAGLTACLIAALVCIAGAVAGDSIGRLFKDPKQAGIYSLLGMLPRMAIPLAFCMVVVYSRGALFEAGMVHYTLVIYLVLLAVSTVTMTRRMAASSRRGEDL